MDPMANRMAVLEELLGRSEQSMMYVLQRLKNAELAVNTLHRAQSDTNQIAEELNNVRRRVDGFDQKIQVRTLELGQHFESEIRSFAQRYDPNVLKVAHDTQQLRVDVGECQGVARKSAEVLQQTQLTLTATERRMDGMQRETHEYTKNVVEHIIHVVRNELLSSTEGESRARIALQDDTVSSMNRFRDDMIKGFSQAASNLRNLDDAVQSLETVLRAEVRSRIGVTDDLALRNGQLAQRIGSEDTKKENLRLITAEIARQTSDMQRAAQDEFKQLSDRVVKSLADLKEVPSAEQSIRRQQIHHQGELNTLRDEVLLEVDNKIRQNNKQLIPRGSVPSASMDDIKDVEERLRAEMRGVARTSRRGATDEQTATMDDIKNLEVSLRAEITKLVATPQKKASEQNTMVPRSELDECAASKKELVELEVYMKSEIARILTQVPTNKQGSNVHNGGSEVNVDQLELLKGIQMELLKSTNEVEVKIQSVDQQIKTLQVLQQGMEEAWSKDQFEIDDTLRLVKDQILVIAQQQGVESSLPTKDSPRGAQEQRVLELELEQIRGQLQRHEDSMQMKQIEVSAKVSELRSYVDQELDKLRARSLSPTGNATTRPAPPATDHVMRPRGSSFKSSPGTSVIAPSLDPPRQSPVVHTPPVAPLESPSRDVLPPVRGTPPVVPLAPPVVPLAPSASNPKKSASLTPRKAPAPNVTSKKGVGAKPK